MPNVMTEQSVGARLDGAPWQRVHRVGAIAGTLTLPGVAVQFGATAPSLELLAPRRSMPNVAADQAEVA